MAVHNFEVDKGATDVSFDISIQQTSDGTPLTGLLYNSAGLTCYYRRGTTGAATALALVTTTVTGAHTDGGFVLISDTNYEGVYKLDISDAIVATGEEQASIVLRGVSGMMPTTINISLKDPINNTNGVIEASMEQIGGDVQSAADLKDFADAGYDPATNKVQGVVLTDTVTTYTGNTPQTGDAFARLGAPAGASVSADIAAQNDLSAAQVNAEVVDALNVDTYAEPGQGSPAATASLAAKIGYLYKSWRNRSTQTATQYSLYNDDALTVDQKATFSDDATTADTGEVTTGP